MNACPKQSKQRAREEEKKYTCMWNDSKVMFRLGFFPQTFQISIYYSVCGPEKINKWKLMCVKFEENAKQWWKTNRSPFRRCRSFGYSVGRSVSISMDIQKTGKISLFHFVKHKKKRTTEWTNERTESTISEWIFLLARMAVHVAAPDSHLSVFVPHSICWSTATNSFTMKWHFFLTRSPLVFHMPPKLNIKKTKNLNSNISYWFSNTFPINGTQTLRFESVLLLLLLFYIWLLLLLLFLLLRWCLSLFRCRCSC